MTGGFVFPFTVSAPALHFPSQSGTPRAHAKTYLSPLSFIWTGLWGSGPGTTGGKRKPNSEEESAKDWP